MPRCAPWLLSEAFQAIARLREGRDFPALTSAAGPLRFIPNPGVVRSNRAEGTGCSRYGSTGADETSARAEDAARRADSAANRVDAAALPAESAADKAEQMFAVELRTAESPPS